MRSKHRRFDSRRSTQPLNLEQLEGRYLLSTYTLTDLGADTFATAVNNLGQVVGYTSDHAFPLHAFLWDNGNFTDLGTLGGATSQALGINDAGQVVGFSEITPVNHVFHAFLWDSSDGMQDLGTFGEFNSYATAINNAGQVVGQITNGQGVLWSDGQMIPLCGQPANCVPYSINNAGQIVGQSNQLAADVHATLWDGPGHVIDLGVLYSPEDSESYAFGMNDVGQVVGRSMPSFRAFFWQDGVMSDLLGHGPSGARAINNLGQIVGFDPGGFIYSDGQLAYLQDLIPPGSGFQYFSPTAINDASQVVAETQDADRIYHGILFTPDNSGAPRGGGIFQLLQRVDEATPIGEVTSQSSASAKGVPVETAAPLPTGAAMRRATDAAFMNRHRIHNPAPGEGWEIRGLALVALE